MNNGINFNEFAGGALAEQLNSELTRVLENIADPNTDARAKRKVTLTLTFKPDEDRELSIVDIKTQANLAPPRPLSTKMLIDKDLKTGKVVGAEYRKQVPGQIIMTVDTETGEVLKEEPANNSADLKIIKISK
ncbi:hypothetical protein SAMN02745975_00551 [Geosporobacter subterraneus DSM 17957]|uniref:Replication terminator protein n=1 Tax=Geosporobacter subterraneus DSM 17957 TaxID=1121919 RepID=A0A1M6DS34_9FIRM|nr:replication terminator protein [Geosporobacter subterraneus]SHI75930.1 hypothetical protein SAMN02745975_00551 [Geosporobacter subterraneus DSM 17957]